MYKSFFVWHISGFYLGYWMGHAVFCFNTYVAFTQALDWLSLRSIKKYRG